MQYVSRHFGVEEWDCYHRSSNEYAYNNSEGYLVTENPQTAKLFMILDALRDCDPSWQVNSTTYKPEFGMSLKSGYRDNAANISCGGEPDSYHTRGCAADIHCGNYNYTDEQIAHAVITAASWYGITEDELGIGFYGDWCHIDTRGYKSRW